MKLSLVRTSTGDSTTCFRSCRTNRIVDTCHALSSAVIRPINGLALRIGYNSGRTIIGCGTSCCTTGRYSSTAIVIDATPTGISTRNVASTAIIVIIIVITVVIVVVVVVIVIILILTVSDIGELALLMSGRTSCPNQQQRHYRNTN
ncbi:hypothetical protein EFM54_02665 [Lentilactobacillus buchneri]|nr:hypothetical protein [Lentilactobacillus buchneri]